MGTLRDILATRHGIDITEQQEQILFDDLYAIMEINKTMNLTRILSEEDGMVLAFGRQRARLAVRERCAGWPLWRLRYRRRFPRHSPRACLQAAKLCSSIRLRRRFALWSLLPKSSALAIVFPRMAAALRTSPLSVRGSFRCSRLAP